MSKQLTAKEKIQKKLETEAAKYLVDVDRVIRRALESATLSLMGIEVRGHRNEIDHCNGRNSVLIDAFRQKALGEAKKIARNVKLSPEEMATFRNAFEKEYSSQVSTAVRRAAQERAAADAKALIESVQMDIEQYITE
jgi:hypothetical protein